MLYRVELKIETTDAEAIQDEQQLENAICQAIGTNPALCVEEIAAIIIPKSCPGFVDLMEPNNYEEPE